MLSASVCFISFRLRHLVGPLVFDASVEIEESGHLSVVVVLTVIAFIVVVMKMASVAS